jgi:recombination protein RecA
MSNLDFLNKVTNDLEKAGMSVGSSEPPRYWFSTGNYVLNRIISGDFHKGIPQGRLVDFAGPSGSGKSFLIGNAVREAQKAGAMIVILDTEHALDDNFMTAIGVDTKAEGYKYIEVDTIPQVKQVVSAVIRGYKTQYDDDPNAPALLFAIDSLDMLLTETEMEQFDKGETKGDQGQRNKQLKAMLRSFVQAIKRLNISMIVTSQVYKNQDLKNGEGNWIVSDAVRFSLSMILLLTKLKLRDKTTRETHGIRMKCEGYKTRFTQPFQLVTIEVPYETGMDPYNGMLDVAEALGIVIKRGSRYTFKGDDKSFYSKNFDAERALKLCDEQSGKFVEVTVDNDDAPPDDETPVKQRRRKKVDPTS